jgi:hypothetical protein
MLIRIPLHHCLVCICTSSCRNDTIQSHQLLSSSTTHSESTYSFWKPILLPTHCKGRPLGTSYLVTRRVQTERVIWASERAGITTIPSLLRQRFITQGSNFSRHSIQTTSKHLGAHVHDQTHKLSTPSQNANKRRESMVVIHIMDVRSELFRIQTDPRPVDNPSTTKLPTQGQVLSASGGHQWVDGTLSDAPVVAF